MTRALWLAGGVILWALHFVAVYGYTGFACARALGGTVPWVVGAATVVAAAVAAVLVVRGWRGRARFEHAIAAGLAGFALLAILWEGVAAFMVPACA